MTLATLPALALPKSCPFLAITPHTKGISASRRSSGVPRSNSPLRTATSWTPPFFLSIRTESAPPKTSCQRRPSVVTSKTFWVLIFPRIGCPFCSA